MYFLGQMPLFKRFSRQAFDLNFSNILLVRAVSGAHGTKSSLDAEKLGSQRCQKVFGDPEKVACFGFARFGRLR